MARYDVVLFGATGFTGRQTATYFLQHAPPGLRWAIAGRSRARLEALGVSADVLVADSRDQASVDAMVAQARVVLSTAGPFALYGTPVVDACVRHGVHYADITGETAWIEQLVARYHAAAAAARLHIVPCCGFDSVPSDLGAYLLVRRHQATTVRGYFQLGGGGLNGGTLASIVNLVMSPEARTVTRASAFTAPHFDPLAETWVAPFFMAPVNTWVVRRSAALFAEWGEPYPQGFNYREYLAFAPPLAALKAIAATTATLAAGLVLRFPVLLRALLPVLPKPGSGPSERKMDEGWFSCKVVGLGDGREPARVLIKNRGDAGNRSTVKMLCEAAFCLALGQTSGRGGVLTPATAFGDLLVNRLRAAGMTVAP